MWAAPKELVRGYAEYYRAKAHSVDDPKAPKEGRAAVFTAIGTCAGAVLAGVAAWVFWCQLGAMDKANEDTERAVLSLSKIELSSDGASSKGEILWTVTGILQNTGRTPTVKMISQNGMTFAPVPVDANGYWFGNQKIPVTYDSIAPNATISAMPETFNVGFIRSFGEGRRALVVWGRAQYSDVFGHSHRLEYCRFTNFPDIQFDKDPGTRVWNITGEPCHLHNCFDGECKAFKAG